MRLVGYARSGLMAVGLTASIVLVRRRRRSRGRRRTPCAVSALAAHWPVASPQEVTGQLEEVIVPSTPDSRHAQGAHRAPAPGRTADAFARLYEAWRPTVIHAASLVLGSGDAAEDVAERVFFRLRKNGGWWGIEDPADYFHRAGRNAGLDEMRRRPPTVPFEGPVVTSLEASSAGPEHTMLLKEVRTRVSAAIGDLPTRCREVSTLVFLRGLTHPEVADRLDISVKAVEKQVARCRRHLEGRSDLAELSTFSDGGGRGVCAS